MHRYRFSTLLIFICLSSGCATITKGGSQDFSVQSRPDGAQCQITRKGKEIGRIESTPGTLSLGKSKHNIQVLCEKEGYLKEMIAVNSKFQGMTVGNAIFGGLIGIAVDSGTGAMNKYPASITVQLIPTVFENESSREQFFANMREAVDTLYQPQRDKLEAECGNPKSRKTACKNELAKLTAEHHQQLTDIETKYRVALLQPTRSDAKLTTPWESQTIDAAGDAGDLITADSAEALNHGSEESR